MIVFDRTQHRESNQMRSRILISCNSFSYFLCYLSQLISTILSILYYSFLIIISPSHCVTRTHIKNNMIYNIKYYTHQFSEKGIPSDAHHTTRVAFQGLVHRQVRRRCHSLRERQREKRREEDVC
jgi:hypothetical protein